MMKLDQRDFPVAIAILETACAKLSDEIRANGDAPDRAPDKQGDSIAYYNALQDYHDRLMFGLKKSAGATATAAKTAANVSSESSPVAVASVEPSAALSADEVAKLTWTERCQLAGNKVTVEQLRANIAARESKKKGAESKAPTAMEKVLTARGVSSLADLQALPARNLD